MANALFDKGREGFLDGSISWTANTIKAVLLDSAFYTPVLATDTYLSDIAVPARIATSPPLVGKTATAGVADADDDIFTLVTGPQAEYLVLYQDTGSDATSRLICIMDTAVGLPVTPSGGDILLTWNNGPNKIFKL